MIYASSCVAVVAAVAFLATVGACAGQNSARAASGFEARGPSAVGTFTHADQALRYKSVEREDILKTL